MRMLIRNDISHAEFSELARQAYVDAAYEHFSLPGRKTTYSRVAVLTGLSRKEVVRLYKLRMQNQVQISSNPNRTVRVVNGWLGDQEFLDSNGNPMPLPLHGDRGSFAVLVARYSGDITLGAVLDELQRVGAVSKSDDNTVSLNNTGYIPSEDEQEKIRIMSICASDLLDSAVHNLDAEATQRFQRQIIHHNVPDELIEEFQAYSTAKATKLLQDINQFLSRRKRTRRASELPGKRVGLGIYYFENQQLNEE